MVRRPRGFNLRDLAVGLAASILQLSSLAGPAGAAPLNWPGKYACHEAGAQAIRLAAIEGRCDWSWDDVKHCLPTPDDFGRPFSGSGNWPIQIVTGLAVCGSNSARETLEPWLTGSGSWGLNGKESGSIIYGGWNLGSAMLALAEAGDDEQWATQLRKWVRATFGFLRLHQVPAGTTLEAWIGGKSAERTRKGTARTRLEAGEWINPTGDRSVIGGNPAGDLLPDRSPLTILYRWCTGTLGKRQFDPHPKRWTWMPAILAEHSGNRGGKALGERYCGMSKAEVKTLRQPLVRDGKPTEALQLAVAMLGEYHHPGQRQRRPARNRQILLWPDGSWSSVLSWTANANKPGVAYSDYDAPLKRARSVVPSIFRGVGARTGSAALHLEDLVVGLSSHDGWRDTFTLPGRGTAPAVRVSWSADRGVELFSGGEQVAGEPPSIDPGPIPAPGPSPPPPVVPPRPTDFDRARRQYARLDKQLNETVQQAESLLQELQRLQLYLERAGRDFGLRKEKEEP